MRYRTIEDLPFVCRINLPEAAQRVYLDAWNAAVAESNDSNAARQRAWATVRARFAREPARERWISREGTQEPAVRSS